MNIILRHAIFSVCFALAACSGGVDESKAIAGAKATFEADLKDPSSVQYRNVEFFHEKYAEYSDGKFDTDTICFEVNAKNSYGAYVGFSNRSCTRKYDASGKTPGKFTCHAFNFCKDKK
ncbi:hypothetical protein [Gallionella capsiferriformans]|uniref:hypothetical protein n=1 Tax=Gallionella capsiferriformans TaxID=370405 RepID=UPI001231E76A|nr:hypothetical protein [Gallionella capsiferriformans]